MSRLGKALSGCTLVLAIIAAVALVLDAQDADSKRPTDDSRAKLAVEEIKKIEMRSGFVAADAKDKKDQDAKEKTPQEKDAKDKGTDRDRKDRDHKDRDHKDRDHKDVVELIERPLLNFGDPARLHESGTVWAFGKVGRPVAFIEMFWGQRSTHWSHSVTLTSLDPRVTMISPTGGRWTPQKAQIEPAAIPDAPAPDAKQAPRLRQMKDLARRFTAHEFWDPDNSRFELRLLVQPIHRYRDAKAGLHDGTAFILAHGTNPEVILLIEALGKTLEEARWHYSLARSSSAEPHVELDGKEVWKRERAPGIVGRPTDPYWMF